MPVTARLKYAVGHEWGKRRHLDISELEEMDELKAKTENQESSGVKVGSVNLR